MLTNYDYGKAIAIQDACNLSGVVFSFAKMMEKICEEAHQLGRGTEWKNQHPIAVLYASKISAMAGAECSLEFSKAYDICIKRADGRR